MGCGHKQGKTTADCSTGRVCFGVKDRGAECSNSTLGNCMVTSSQKSGCVGGQL